MIKHERQLRRLLTYSVYQFPVFGPKDVDTLRRTLAANREIYAEGFIRGLDVLWPQSVATLIGPRYAAMATSINEAVAARGKIFHGQVTELGLDRTKLLGLVTEQREWCTLLAKAADASFGYDGFGRDSYRKGPNAQLHTRFAIQIKSLPDYATFHRAHVTRPKKSKKS